MTRPTTHPRSRARFYWDCEPAQEFDLQRFAAESFVEGIVFRRRLDSTNNLSLQVACDPALPTPLLVLTERQTAGRGRDKNLWWSARGGLTFSLLLDRSVAMRSEHWPRISLASAVAVCQVLETFVPGIPCGIRWPNDVLMGGRKICGILPELPPDSAHLSTPPRNFLPDEPSAWQDEEIADREPYPKRFVVGIGVNLNNKLTAAPADVRATGTSLLELTGKRHDMTEFLIQLLRRISVALRALVNDDQELSENWSRRCCLCDKNLDLHAGPLHVRGLCRGIDTRGALVVLTATGLQRFVGGRISLF